MTATVFAPVVPDPDAWQHRAELRAAILDSRPYFDKTCATCHRPYQSRSKQSKYCAGTCWKRAQRITDRRQLTPDEWIEDVTWLIENGSSVAAVCQSMHAKPSAIAKRLRRSRPEYAAMFERFK